MTAQINTRSGGKTEARVGDRCEYLNLGDDIIRFTVEEVTDDGWLLYQNGRCGIAPEYCTLLSRPFAVGDSIEHNYPLIGWKDCGLKIDSPDALDMLNQLNAIEVVYRHTNSDWRSES